MTITCGTNRVSIALQRVRTMVSELAPAPGYPENIAVNISVDVDELSASCRLTEQMNSKLLVFEVARREQRATLSLSYSLRA